MAITKYKAIKDNLQAVINYAKNGKKTENGILVSGINCLPENAYYEMQLVKNNFHKEDGRLGYHIIQSFQKGEITPEKCNKIGVKFANQLWGDKYQVLVCTHTNKENIHNHIILNSVSFVDGNKYHNSKADIAFMKQVNDDLCFKNGLSVVDTEKANKSKEVNQARISNFNRSSGKMALIKNDIDTAIEGNVRYLDFVTELELKGYCIKKAANTLSLKTPYFNRNIRLARTYGEEYTLLNIKMRITDRDYYKKYIQKEIQNRDSEKIYRVRVYDGVKINKYLLKTSSFYRIYVHYMYLFGRLPAKVHYEVRTPEYYEEIKKFSNLCEELNLITSHKLQTVADAQQLKSTYTGKIGILKEQKEEYIKLYSKTENETDKTILKARVSIINEDVEHLNFHVQTCRRIIKNFAKGEKEQAQIQKRINENRQNNQRIKSKIKDKTI